LEFIPRLWGGGEGFGLRRKNPNATEAGAGPLGKASQRAVMRMMMGSSHDILEFGDVRQRQPPSPPIPVA
jgi:hypothetical protein